jgi:hypothetical protein
VSESTFIHGIILDCITRVQLTTNILTPTLIECTYLLEQPIPVATLCGPKCGSEAAPLLGLVGSNPARGMDVCVSLASVLCCQVYS